MRKGRSSALSFGAMALVTVLLVGGCAPSTYTHSINKGDPSYIEPTEEEAQSSPENELLDLLKPLSASPDGAYVAVGLDGVTLYDRSGAGTDVAAKGKKIRGLHWSPRGHWLLVNAAGPAILLIEPATGTVADLTDQFPGLKNARLTVSWSPDEREALVAEGWHTASQSTVWLLEPHAGTARQVTAVDKLEQIHWLEGGKGVLQVSAGCCGPMNLFVDLAHGTILPAEGFSGGGSFAPDARRFALAPYMGASLTIRDLVSGESQTLWREPPGEHARQEGVRYGMSPGLWSPDGRILALTIDTWAEDGKASLKTLHVVDAADGTQLALVRNVVPTMEWLPQGGGLLYATRNGQDLSVHVGDRVLATHQGGSVLGTDPNAPLGVLSPDNSKLAYTVTYETGPSQMFIADLGTGEVTAVPESVDLSPLMWTTREGKLLVAHLPMTHAYLPGGTEAVGREVSGLRLIQP